MSMSMLILCVCVHPNSDEREEIVWNVSWVLKVAGFPHHLQITEHIPQRLEATHAATRNYVI